MLLKPRKTELNQQAIVYRHFNDEVEGKITLDEDLGTTKVISKYELNKYYRYMSFDYVITSDESTTQVQYIKGLQVEETILDIKYYNDELGLLHTNDLVLIGGRLYQVEEPTRTKKRMPKPYYVYTCTLKSIL